MIPELGVFALILASFFAKIQGTIPFILLSRNPSLAKNLINHVVVGQIIFILLAYTALTWSFVSNDFSVLYVAMHSSQELPLWYRITAVWGGHEGSLLLWISIFALWMGAVSIFSKTLPIATRVRVLAVMGLISVGFLLFILATSNPFERLLPVAPENGVDLNPLLQDPGFLFHPPILYMGYVGFSVVFAFAIAALLAGKMDPAWSRWVRPWTLVAWGALTAGIALGSWWAYRVLGWGGWWFWDPVENASFMPWLAGTALVHSLIASDKRNSFKGWTILLAILAFSLSLLGTFLVRSGVLVSVHAFAVDPTRGIFILLLLLIVVGSSLLLYAWRGTLVRTQVAFDILSRETALLLNNILLLVTLATVLLGTLYPLIIDTLNLGKLSVGAPYFNRVFVPLMVPLLFFMALGPISNWKSMPVKLLLMRLRWSFIMSLSMALLLPALLSKSFSMLVVLGVFLALWIMSTTLRDWIRRANLRPNMGWWRFLSLGRSYYGMLLAHTGIAICVLGVTLTTYYSQQRDVRMALGDEIALPPYTFKFVSIDENNGSNYEGIKAQFEVHKGKRLITTISARKQYFTIAQEAFSQPGIQFNLWRDLYVALGEPLPNATWGVRLYVKPFVRWIWWGAIAIVLGAIVAASSPSYRSKIKQTISAQG